MSLLSSSTTDKNEEEIQLDRTNSSTMATQNIILPINNKIDSNKNLVKSINFNDSMKGRGKGKGKIVLSLFNDHHVTYVYLIYIYIYLSI